MRRRDFVTAAGAAGLALWTRGLFERAAAASHSAIPFGAAVSDGPLQTDAAYQKALIEHCQLLVGEGGMKWADLRPSPSQYVYDQPDRLIAFAEANGMKMRGHTLAWYAAMPDWALQLKGEAETSRELMTHIETVVGRYKGRIPSWDVVNEALSDDGPRVGLRDSVWAANLGEYYIDLAFHTARAADPAAQLVINDYGLEAATAKSSARRRAMLDLLRRLRDRDVPVQALGFQAHLPGNEEIDKDEVSRFVSDVKDMGLDVLVTELDVIDDQLPADIEERDAIAAKRVGALLGAILDVTRPTAVVTWGITDRYTWVPIWYKRADGQANRPLPLDEDYREKPMMRTIKQAVAGA